jgi:glycine oxidase
VSKSFDVAVVGAGIIGAAIAYECAGRGARVVLLDRDQPGGAASGAAAGMLAPCSEAHAVGPFLDLARGSLCQWPQFAARVREAGGVDPELDLDGLLRVALDEDAGRTIQDRLRWQQDTGISDGSWVDAATARDLEPALHQGVAGAAWYPNEGHVHSRHAVRALVAAAKAHGAEVKAGAEVIGEAAPTGTIALRDGTRIESARVVLAAGAWLSRLAQAFGGCLPVEPVHGQLLVLTGVPRPPKRVVFAGLHGYAVGKRDGTVLVGATEEPRGFDTTPDPAHTTTLRAQAARLIAGTTAATVTQATWTGLRPAAPDRLPLLGPLPGRDVGRVLVAGGHYRNGVLLAPATARGIADLALEGRTPEGWGAFDPRRLG